MTELNTDAFPAPMTSARSGSVGLVQLKMTALTRGLPPGTVHVMVLRDFMTTPVVVVEIIGLTAGGSGIK